MKNTGHNTAAATLLPAPGLRTAITLLAVLALAVGFATARAQDTDVNATGGWNGYENQPLRANIWHDRGDDDVYQRGEAVRVHFETNSDAYAVVYRIDTEGRVSILWPRSRYDDGFVFGHHTYNLPTPGAERIRTAGEEGVEYVQVVVSAYPFDLRGLEVGFHHERDGGDHAYYVAGDPFLAMNDVNYAVTGLDDPADFVVTNYLSYYVHRRVDHPRYMCTQCHDDDQYRPYDDVCVIEIHHDYGWDNDWYDRYGYYPAYYYPVYVYVDPWTWRPWINYWYRPWYAWPVWGASIWNYDCYVWNYSPYWRGDVWTRYKTGNRRYRPIDKNQRYSEHRGDGDYNHPGGLVKTPRPNRDELAAMDRTGAVRKGDTAKSDRLVRPRTDYKNRDRTVKPVAGFTKRPRDDRAPGIRVPRDGRLDASVGSGGRPGVGTGRDGRAVTRPSVRPAPERGGQDPSRIRSGDGIRNVKPDAARDQEGARTVRPRPDNGADAGSRVVRPVKPRSQGSRIWQGGSRDQKPDRTVKPRPDSGSKPPTSTVKPRSNSGGSTPRKTPTVKPRSNKASSSSKSTSGGKSGSSVKSRSSGSSKSSGSMSRSGSSSSSSSKSSGKSNSSRSKRR